MSRQPFRMFADFTGADPRFREPSLGIAGDFSFTAINPLPSSFVFHSGVPNGKPVLTIHPDGRLEFADASEAAAALMREWNRMRGVTEPAPPPAPLKRPEGHAECILGKCPDPGMCDLMTNCEAWAIRRDFNAERDA
jgi:hypothetical protein